MEQKYIILSILALILILGCAKVAEEKISDNNKADTTNKDNTDLIDNNPTDEINVPKETTELILTAEKQSDGSVKLSWNEFSGDFLLYKIVRAVDDATPTYPSNGFIETISDVKTTNYVDRQPYGGISYYSVAVVKPLNQYLQSNPVTIEFPDPDEVTPDQEITVSVEKTTDGIQISWNQYNGDFLQYKVVRSQDNPNPKYPKDRLLKTIPYVEQNSYLDRTVKSGVNYYAVTIMKKDNTKFTTRAVEIEV